MMISYEFLHEGSEQSLFSEILLISVPRGLE